MTGASSRRRWLVWLERLAAAIVVAFLVGYLARNWSQVQAHDWSVDWLRMTLSFGLLGVVYSGFVLLWRQVLDVLGARLSAVDAHRIWYLSNLGRYVPGRVVQLAGTAYMARAKGVSPALAVASTIVAQAFVIGGGFVAAALLLPEAAAGTGPWRTAGLVAAVGFLVVMLTPLFGILRRMAARVLGREEWDTEVPWTVRLALTAGYVAAWFALGGAFVLFLTSLTPVPAAAYAPVAGIFAAGYLAGFLAVFVPGGLGVREGVHALLLALYIPSSIAVAVAIAARIWSTAVEIIVSGALVARYGVADLRAAPRAGEPEFHG